MITFSMNTAKSNTEAEVLDQYIYRISMGDKNSLGALYEETKSAIYGFAFTKDAQKRGEN